MKGLDHEWMAGHVKATKTCTLDLCHWTFIPEGGREVFLFYFLHFICVIVIDEGGPILFLFSLKNNIYIWLAAQRCD